MLAVVLLPLWSWEDDGVRVVVPLFVGGREEGKGGFG